MNNHEEHSVSNACWKCSLDLSKCACVVSMPTPNKPTPAERNLSFQIKRAIKAEDALHVARKEIKNLNALLNATYVAPVDPQNVMQINDRAIEIFRALHGQASPDIEDSLRLTVAQVLKESTQPVPEVNAMLVEALEEARNGLAWYQAMYPGATDGSDDEAMERIDAAIAGAIKQGGQHD